MEFGCCGTTKNYLGIKEIGFDYIELSGRQIMGLSDREFSAFRGLYHREGFPCYGFNDYCDAHVPMIGPGYDRERTRKYADGICNRGYALGIKNIGIGAPAARRLPVAFPLDEARKQLKESLAIVCEVAEPKGIRVLLEAVHKYACDYINTTPEAVELVKELELPNLYIVLDYYHAMVMGEDLYDLSYAMPYVKHLHISTNLENYSRGYLKKVDYPLLKRLIHDAKAGGYDKTMSIEAHTKDLDGDGRRCLNLFRQADAEYPRSSMGSNI